VAAARHDPENSPHEDDPLKAAPFEYARAGSVDDACALLALHGDSAKPIAGGQSLVPMMAMRLARPAWLVDINHIDTLKHITPVGGHLRTGACTRQCVLERDAMVGAVVPLIGQALVWVGHAQTRNRGTVGGSLAHADPSAELPLVARLLGATINARTARGSRSVSAADFLSGPMMTSLAPDELLESIDWPVWTDGCVGSAFDELGIRHGDFAIVAAGAQVALDPAGRCIRAAFGLGGVDQTPLDFPALAAKLVGSTLDDATIDGFAAEVAQAIEPGGDLHATPAYRRHLARVLGARVLRRARDAAVRASAPRTAVAQNGESSSE